MKINPVRWLAARASQPSDSRFIVN